MESFVIPELHSFGLEMILYWKWKDVLLVILLFLQYDVPPQKETASGIMAGLKNLVVWTL